LRTFRCFCFYFLVHIIIINWIFVPLHVCCLVTTPPTLVINVLTLHLNAFIYLVMSASMNICFHVIILNRLQRSWTHPLPNSPLSSSRICSPPHYYPPIQLYHPKQPPCHSLQPSSTHHHMHVYLTIMMQVQLVHRSHLATRMPPLLVSGRSLVPPFTSPSLARDNATTDSTSAYSPSSAWGRFSLSPSG
jgi:hypothetical protein